MISSTSIFGSSSVVFDGTTAYVIPTSDFNSEEEELVKTFHCLEDAEAYCDKYSQGI